MSKVEKIGIMFSIVTTLLIGAWASGTWSAELIQGQSPSENTPFILVTETGSTGIAAATGPTHFYYSLTTATQTVSLSATASVIVMANWGTPTVYISFDNDSLFPLGASGTASFQLPIKTFYLKAATAGTALLYGLWAR